MAKKITDLPVDALSNIMSLLAKSSDGAKDIGKSMSVCKLFLEVCNSNIVLKAANFENVLLYRLCRFQETGGLLCSCASVANISAQCLLAKVILMSCTQLKYIGLKSEKLNFFLKNSLRYRGSLAHVQMCFIVASFVVSFTPGKGSDSSSSRRSFLFHWELVKVFLTHCTPTDISDMRQHIEHYVEYFMGSHIRSGTNAGEFMHYVCSMSMLGRGNLFVWMARWGPKPSSIEVLEEFRVNMLQAFDCTSRDFLDFVDAE